MKIFMRSLRCLLRNEENIMKDRIQEIFAESSEVKQKTLEGNLDKIEAAANILIEAVSQNKKILLFGNGGSAADSQHIAAEFIGRFQKERRAVAAIALTTDSSILTSLSNDYSYEMIFARQIEGLGQEGDVALGISTSGQSANVIEGLKKAHELGLKTIALTGNGGGKMGEMVDINLDVPSIVTARIQEAHICIYHTLCELVEDQL